MNTLINKYHQLFTAGWIAAALAILVYNFMILMTVLNSPVPKFSNNVLRVQQLSQQLDTVRNAGKERLAEAEALDLSEIFSRYLPKMFKKILSEPVTKRSTPSASPHQRQQKEVLVFPEVAGIYHVSGKEDEHSSLVLINRKYYRQDEKINGFTIQEITSEGVKFSKNGSSYFVPAPKGLYSITHADGS